MRVAIAITLVVLLAGGGALINLRLIDAHNANLDPVTAARFTTAATAEAPSRLVPPVPPAPPASDGAASPGPASGSTDAPTTAAAPSPAPGVTTRTPNPAPAAVVTSHSLGAAGAQEAIYCLLMMKHGFAAESAHIENLDPEFEGMPILRKRHDGELKHVMSNSFGFGGTNGTLILSKV